MCRGRERGVELPDRVAAPRLFDGDADVLEPGVEIVLQRHLDGLLERDHFGLGAGAEKFRADVGEVGSPCSAGKGEKQKGEQAKWH